MSEFTKLNSRSNLHFQHSLHIPNISLVENTKRIKDQVTVESFDTKQALK